jgi:hypothetical protein
VRWAAIVAITATIAAMGEPACGCAEYRLLQAKFSTGATLREITSVAEVISLLAQIPGPSREAKRNVGEMVRWFKWNWGVVRAWLPLLHLRDSDNLVIDGTREIGETKGLL